MAIGGIIGLIFICIGIITIAAFVIYACYENDSVAGMFTTGILAFILCVAAYGGIKWYYGNTASGQRALKTQESEFSNGIERVVRVYDVSGQLIQTYDGKFDITYDSDRILFDDENGKRHIVYYTTGTVIIDEK